MAVQDIQVAMTPSHPGEFIRAEVVEELGLNVSGAPNACPGGQG